MVGILVAVSSSGASAQTAPQPADPNTIVVTAPGGLFDRLETEAVAGDDIRGAGQPDLLGALSRSVPGLSLQEAQSNPFQPNIVYRGFTASPLQGQPQGLAVYVDGGRFNQPFGDTVQFDLLPQAAVERVDIFDSSPVYGLNALGGAVVIQTKTGRDAPGLFVSADAGDHGQLNATAEAGWSGSRASAYVAVQRSHDRGWRRFSPSDLSNGFADLGWDGERAGIHLKLLAADTDLTGNGSAPVELLRADYQSVFTHPDETRHHYLRASLHPWVKLAAGLRLEATIYRQRLSQRTINGDAADIALCEEAADLLCLENAEGEESPLLGSTGVPIGVGAGEAPYAVLNLSSSTSDASGLLAQFVAKQPVAGRPNVLVLGLSRDSSSTRFASSSVLGLLTEDRGVHPLGPIIAQPDGSITPVSLVARTRYSGLFVSDRLALSRRLSAVLDLRWNDARVALQDLIGTSLDGAHRYRRINPGIQLEWRIGGKSELRAGYSETNRAPTPAELSCADPQAPCSLTNFFVGDPPLRQVVAHSFEGGGEGKVDRVEWLVSAYRTTNTSDIQYVASETRGRAFFRNVGSTRRQGLEATLGYRKGGLTVRAGYAFTDATFRTAVILNSPDNPRADGNGQIIVEPGDQLPGVPRHRALVSAGYETKRWSVGADVQVASGQRFFGDEANLVDRVPSYSVVDLRGSVRLIGHLSVFAEAKNLFDIHYSTFGTFSETAAVDLAEAPGASDPRSVSPGAPRRWLAGVKAQF
jgi:outer membrane receptor protein involved in Fe transport